jgi:hypothetical protein
MLKPFTWQGTPFEGAVERDELESKTSYTDRVQWRKEYMAWYETSTQFAP